MEIKKNHKKTKQKEQKKPNYQSYAYQEETLGEQLKQKQIMDSIFKICERQSQGGNPPRLAAAPRAMRGSASPHPRPSHW